MEAFQCCTLKAGYGYTQSTHFNLSQVYRAIFLALGEMSVKYK